ncbi:MAG: pilus assembly protein PilM, partial [Thermus sp.]
IFAAAQEEAVRSHVELLQAVGLEPHAIEVEPLAVSRPLLDMAGPEVGMGETVAILNIGASTTEIAIVKDRLLHFPRTIPIGGENLTKAIAEAIGVSPPRVHKYLMDLFERYQAPPEEVEMYRRLELERLDRATMLAMRKIEEGDLAGIDRLVRIIDLRMRILGAYNIQQVRADLPIRLLWPEEVEA